MSDNSGDKIEMTGKNIYIVRGKGIEGYRFLDREKAECWQQFIFSENDVLISK